MLGDDVVDRVRVVNHDARDDAALAFLGEHGNGVPVWVNREWVEADLRITTGFVEPHFFAGFSGGPKLVAPGLAGLDTVLVLHNAARIGDPNATWGVIEGNPVHDDIRAVAAPRRRDFTLRRAPQPRAAHRSRRSPASSLAMHAAACEAARRLAMQPVPSRSTSSSRATPASRSTRTSTRRSRACRPAAKVVKPGGQIVCAAECRDGFPGHGSYRSCSRRSPRRRELLREIAARRATVPDQWQVQIQANIQEHARVVMHTAT